MSHSSDMVERMERPMHEERMHHARPAKLLRRRGERADTDTACNIHRRRARKAAKGTKDESWEGIAAVVDDVEGEGVGGTPHNGRHVGQRRVSDKMRNGREGATLRTCMARAGRGCVQRRIGRCRPRFEIDMPSGRSHGVARVGRCSPWCCLAVSDSASIQGPPGRP